MIQMKSLFIFVVILFSACKGGQPVQENTPSDVPFQVLINASQSNIEEPQRRIIDNQKELESLFAEINKTRDPEIPIPEIDFDKEIIAFVNLGQTSTGGYTITVENIEMTKNEVVIHTGGTSPKSGDNVTMVITTPFTIVKLNKQILPIVFEPKLKQ